MRLGINITDLDRHKGIMLDLLLRDKLDLTSSPLILDKDRFDEACVIFTCDVVTAAAACDIVRGKDRRLKQLPTRCYFQVKDAWNKLPHEAVLTKVVGSEVKLNEKWFPRESKRRDVVVPTAKKISVGVDLLRK